MIQALWFQSIRAPGRQSAGTLRSLPDARTLGPAQASLRPQKDAHLRSPGPGRGSIEYLASRAHSRRREGGDRAGSEIAHQGEAGVPAGPPLPSRPSSRGTTGQGAVPRAPDRPREGRLQGEEATEPRREFQTTGLGSRVGTASGWRPVQQRLGERKRREARPPSVPARRPPPSQSRLPFPGFTGAEQWVGRGSPKLQANAGARGSSGVQAGVGRRRKSALPDEGNGYPRQ